MQMIIRSKFTVPVGHLHRRDATSLSNLVSAGTAVLRCETILEEVEMMEEGYHNIAPGQGV